MHGTSNNYRKSLKASDDIIAAVDAACDSYDAKLARERDDAGFQQHIAEDVLKGYGGGVMCTCLQRNPAGELIPHPHTGQK